MRNPFGIASHAMPIHVMAQAAGLRPGDFIHSFGVAHLHHPEQARLQLTREPRRLPKLRVHRAVRSRCDSAFRAIALGVRDPHPAIKAAAAV